MSRDRGRRRVSVTLDVVGHAVVADPEPHRHELVDPQVGLVRQQHVDVVDLDSRFGRDGLDDVGHRFDRMLEHQPAFHHRVDERAFGRRE